MAREKLHREGCDALDLTALWPCTAQLGVMPIFDIPPHGRPGRSRRQEEEGDGGT